MAHIAAARHNPSGMNQRERLLNLSMARLGFGGLALLTPRAFTRMLFGRGHAGRATSLLVRMWAAREMALGLATMHALESDDEPSRRIVEINAAVDGVDALGTVVAWPALPRRTRLTMLAGAMSAVAVSADYLRSAPRA